MGLFDAHIAEIRDYVEVKRSLGMVRTLFRKKHEWPEGGRKNVVLSSDAAVELGNPRTESVSFLVWTESPGMVKDGSITIIGGDLQSYRGSGFARLPFGKVVIAGVRGFDGGNSFERYREMESVRYGLDLRGYMMKAASQYMREWCRVSKEAIDAGFSFSVLGSALIDSFHSFKYVESAEVIFVASGSQDVAELRPATEKVMKIINAMNKMSVEMSFDCNACEYLDVCSDVSELRIMRESLRREGRHE